MSIRNNTTVHILFPQLPQPVSEFWMCLIESLRLEKALPNSFKVSLIAGFPEERRPPRGTLEPKLAPEKVRDFIIDHDLAGFAVKAGSRLDNCLRYALSEASDAPFARFSSRHDPKALVPATWNTLCQNLVSNWASIGGWIYQVKYQSWQLDRINEDGYDRIYGPVPPGYRICQEKDYHGRTLFDISLNPGRPKELFLEPQSKWMNKRFYPTAEMWLGPHFWQYAKCTKEEALAADFWLETRDTPHYTYFKCWPAPFTRPDGEQGRMQQRLWKLFFHEDCEWPPGSGTICDEPMYGPKELWPEGIEYPYSSTPTA